MYSICVIKTGEETLVNVWIYDKDFNDEPEQNNKMDYNFDKLFIKKEFPQDDIFDNKKCIKQDISKIETPIEIPTEKCPVDNCDRLADFISNSEESLKVLEDMEDDKKINTTENPKQHLLSLNSITQIDDYIEKNEQILNGFLKNNIFDNQETFLNSIGVTEQNINISHAGKQDARDFKLVYLEDHCYTKLKEPNENLIVKQPKYAVGKNNWTTLDANYLLDKDKYKIHVPLEYFKTISQIVYYFFKNLPLVSQLASETSYICSYPYAAVSLEQFQSWSVTKQFCAEVRLFFFKKYV